MSKTPIRLAADMAIQEGERFTGLQGLDPERNLAKLDRHWVAVDAIDTM
jgi:hypothetical protein